MTVEIYLDEIERILPNVCVSSGAVATTRSAVRTFEEFIQAGHVVLSHCRAGQSRSVSVIAAYLKRAGICATMNDAYAFIADKRRTGDLVTPSLKESFMRIFDNDK